MSQDEVLLLWRALRGFRSGAPPGCAPRGHPSGKACPLFTRWPRWHAQVDDRTASLAETLDQIERLRAAWPCSAVIDLLSPELTRQDRRVAGGG